MWAVKGGGTGIDIGRGIQTDLAGNALVTGSFTGSTALLGTTNTTLFLTSANGSVDVFVAKYNSTGAVQEAIRAGGGTADFGHAIGTDQVGRAYFTGSFTGSSAAFGSATLTTNTLAEIFVARYIPATLLLPVELISFKAVAQPRKVALAWQTSSEKDNDYFVVERSAEGLQFEPVLQVKGAGTTTGIRAYTADDIQPLPGTSYYRLRQTDFDGTFAYSPVVAVTYKGVQVPAISELKVFPNPSNGLVQVQYLSSGKAGSCLRVTDAIGRVVLEKTFSDQAGSGSLPLDLTGFRPGLYLVQLQSGNIFLTEKLLLK